MYSDIIAAVKECCRKRPGYCLGDIDVSDIDRLEEIDGEKFLFMKHGEGGIPSLFAVRDVERSGEKKVVPYFLIQNNHNRHIVSYRIGKGLCNLSEVREVFGSLYSRCSASYGTEELPHRDGADSKIALWIHDCLTGDFDHKSTLNRRELPSGITVSYDFGKCFTSLHFPNNYAEELGLEDASIAERSVFIVGQLRKYTHLFHKGEGVFVSDIMEEYPETGNEEKLMEYFNSFKVNLPMRLYYGRLFDSFLGLPFDRLQIEPVLKAAEVDIGPIIDWDSLIAGLSEHQERCFADGGQNP